MSPLRSGQRVQYKDMSAVPEPAIARVAMSLAGLTGIVIGAEHVADAECQLHHRVCDYVKVEFPGGRCVNCHAEHLIPLDDEDNQS